MPLRMMAANQQLAGLTIADVAVQLKCHQRRVRPASVVPA